MVLRAQDRNALPSGDDVIGDLGRTQRREARIRSVLERRQPSLAIVLEDVHDPHNVSAVLRSCDATGVIDVHLVYVHDEPPRRQLHHGTSGSAVKWMRTHVHDSIASCYAALRANEFRILVTALLEDSQDIYSSDLTSPVALVFGNEHRGASNAAVNLADGAVSIPMQGMVESLNISVACAVSLFEAMRQRRVAGMYDTPQLSSEDIETIEMDWIRR